MRSGSGGFSHEVKQQRKHALVWNFVLPLIVTVVIMLVVAMVVNVSFYRFEMDSALSTARSLASDRVRTADEVIRDYPGAYVLYFDGDLDLVTSFGNPDDLERRPDKLQSPSEVSSIDMGGVRYIIATLEMSKSTPLEDMPDGAESIRYVRVYINVGAEEALRLRITLFCVAFFVIVFAIQSLIGFFGGVNQTKPFIRALERNNRLIADISHEFNTPLAIVNSDIARTLEKPEVKVKDVSEQLVSALNETQRLKRMIKELLILSASDAQKLDLKFENVDISAILKELAEPFSMMAELDGKTFVDEVDEGITAIVDTDKFRQITIALLDNAMKYTSEGESVTLSLRRKGGKIVLGVFDTGKGVPDEDMVRIFERFYRTDGSRNGKTGGAGLGLAIVKEIVSNMGAKIFVHANAPKGFAVEVEWDVKSNAALGKSAAKD
ncbi:MAG TPA: HAMP domain-containing histidine kinase [Candidatus Ornithoclostridium faecigallinarum]|nr:HAMP domain-containing histidine kinase [Candidatus Ornithoclostridium faecigallinarum]